MGAAHGKPGGKGWTVLAVIAWSGLLLGAAAPDPETPQPPCAGTPNPPYPALGNAPALKAWDPAVLGHDWTPPACTGWTGTGFTSLVGMAARFRLASGTDLLRRMGAISAYAGMRYWSATSRHWKTLVVSASAVTGPTGGQSRKDYAPEELTVGADLYFQQEDNLSGKATYRMRILEAGADRLAFATENVTTMRYLMWRLFKPGELQAIYYFHRESAGVWRFYGLSRTGRNASSLTAGHDASTENRSVAFYRYLAGIPTDQEPPGAP